MPSAGVPAQAPEVLLGAEELVDAHVVRRIVAVVARRLEDGVEVDRRDAHLGEVGEVLLDAAQGSPVEVPAADGARLVAVVDRGRVPVLDDVLLAAPPRMGEAVGEDLVHDAPLVPRRSLGAVPVDGDLEGGDVGAVVVGDPLAAHMALGGAHAALEAVGGADDEAVPHDVRIAPAHGDAVAARAVGRHGVELLADPVDPGAQGAFDACRVLLDDLEGQGDLGAGGHGPEGGPVSGQAAVVSKLHSGILACVPRGCAIGGRFIRRERQTYSLT